MSDLNPTVARVTERIVARSKDSRRRYLDLMDREGERHGSREFLSCSNLAHGFAASGAGVEGFFDAFFATGRSPAPTGSAHLLTAPYQAFHASDGYVNIGGANQANWERIADVLGHPEWRADPRFATNTARMAHREELAALMNGVLGGMTRAEWIAALDAAGVPAGPVHSLGEALSHPQTLARGMVVDLVHPEAGPTKAIGCPVHFARTPAAVTRPAPRLGEHTRDVLRETGYDDAAIDAFVAAGIVATAA